jgi:hypothetical protein
MPLHQLAILSTKKSFEDGQRAKLNDVIGYSLDV